jgi:hypothetical protein
MLVTSGGSPTALASNASGPDGDTTTYTYADFRGPPAGAVYGTGAGKLNWNFLTDWDFLSNPSYPYPVWSGQTSLPTGGPSLP